MGRTRLSKFKKMHAPILESDWKTVPVEGRDSRWHKQVTNPAERLMVRESLVQVPFVVALNMIAGGIKWGTS